MQSNVIFILVLLSLLISKVVNSYEISVADKYNDIFTENILSNFDVENYRKIQMKDNTYDYEDKKEQIVEAILT